MLEAYRKFRSLLRQPLFGTVAQERPAEHEADHDEPHPEAPDVSHVSPPPVEPATRDEALELVERRLNILAGRADRLERARELIDPSRLEEVAPRADVEELRTRMSAGERVASEFETRLAALHEAHAKHTAEASTDRAAISGVTATQRTLEESIRLLGTDLRSTRESIAALNDALRVTRQEFADRDALRAREITKRLAGLYILAFVALLGSLAAIVLYLVAPHV